MRHFRWAVLAACAAASVVLQGCEREGCVGGEASCRVEEPCQKLEFSCSDNSLELKTLAKDDEAYHGWNALSSEGDIQLGNSQMVAVISKLGNQNFLDPNGGSLLDLYVRGKDNDGLNQVLTVVGVLPRDAAHYTSMELIDERPNRVAVQLKGTLDGQPDIPVYTLYEVRPCEPGIRIRTEIVNGSDDQQLFALSDGFYWSKREPLPFTPREGAGFVHPSFGLLTINNAFFRTPYLAASSHSKPWASYSLTACNQDFVEGFQSETVSSGGLARTVVPPRGYQVYERFLAVADTRDVHGGTDIALDVRKQLFGEQFVTVTGKVERPAALALDTERESSVLISEGTLADAVEKRTPITQVVPDVTGAFQARVPAGKTYVIEVHSFGRKVVEREVQVSGDTDLGSFTLPATAKVTFNVTDAQNAQGVDAEIFVVPADDATREAVTGTLHGQFGTCSPWLGPPSGSSPACNRVLLRLGQGQAEIPVGKYHLYAFKGPFWTIARRTETLTPADATLTFQLRKLPLQPQGTLTGDFHVHGAASFDSSIPDYDRVLSFSATDLQVIVATDHDVVYDYSAVLSQLQLQDKMSAVTGVETTGHIPWMYAPGNPYPLVIGHYNFWPLRYEPWKPRNGGPFDEFLEPGELMDAVEPLYASSVPVAELNHPWADAEFGRDLGFPRAVGVNALKDLPADDDGTNGGFYVRARGKNRNNAHHAQEVMNGTQNDMLPAYRAFWFYVLNQGQFAAGTANSDSHSLTDNTVGVPRNVVYTDTLAGPSFNVDRLNTGIRKGELFGTNGPVIEATIDDAQGVAHRFGFQPFKPAAGAKLKLKVSAAPWVPVTEVRFVVNGQVVKTLGPSALLQPQEPFGETELVRFDGEVALSELLPSDRDAWLVIEAGVPLPLFADLAGGPVSKSEPRGAKDGIPDTSDNNGDGVVDEKDIASGAKYGPLKTPLPPADDSLPLFHFGVVVTDGYPYAFTNPFVIDANGNGAFEAPGVEGK